MPTPRVYRTEALVLKAFDYGEADRILTLFSAQHGKMRALAKGVRRTKSRMSGHLDLFIRSQLLIARGRQLDIVTQAETVDTYPAMRTDLGRLAAANYLAELLDGFMAEHLPNHAVYALATETLSRLASSADIPLTLRAFELKLLTLAGYRPQLHRCLHCDETIQARENYFSAGLGGILCPGCREADRASVPISVSALKLLRNLQTNEAMVLRTGSIPAETMQEVERRLQEYVIYRLENRPRSLGFLERLQHEGEPDLRPEPASRRSRPISNPIH